MMISLVLVFLVIVVTYYSDKNKINIIDSFTNNNDGGDSAAREREAVIH